MTNPKFNNKACIELIKGEYHNYERNIGGKCICDGCFESDSESELEADSEEVRWSQLKRKSEKL